MGLQASTSSVSSSSSSSSSPSVFFATIITIVIIIVIGQQFYSRSLCNVKPAEIKSKPAPGRPAQGCTAWGSERGGCDHSLVSLHRGPQISASALESTLQYVRDNGLPSAVSRRTQLRARHAAVEAKHRMGKCCSLSDSSLHGLGPHG